MSTFKHVISGTISVITMSMLASGCLSGYARADDGLVVSAAASLKPAFTELIRQYQSANPAATVKSNFASSTQLASQISQGARVDVFASADRKTMNLLAKEGMVKDPKAFAFSKLTVIFANQVKFKPSLDALARPELRVVMPSPKIPAAGYIAEFLMKADAAGIAGGQLGVKVQANTVSQEPDARMVVAKVAMGEADAAIVYVTDLTADLRGKVTEVPIPANLNVSTEYVLASVQKSANAQLASSFVDYVHSTKGKAVLHSFGFSTE